MKHARRDYTNIGLLAGCEAIFMSTALINVTISGLAARTLLDDHTYATLPQALIPLVSMFGAIPASYLMHYIGRRNGFLIGVLAGTISGAICTAALFIGSFSLFLFGAVFLGIYQSFAAYYRFAVADHAPEEIRARAISMTMSGGILAAVIGPVLAGRSTEWLAPIMFAGSYSTIILLNALAAVALVFLKLPQRDKSKLPKLRFDLAPVFRSHQALMAMAACGVGSGMMMLVMTSTPLAMDGCGFDVVASSAVISWHVAAMFIPFLFSGILIERFGVIQIIFFGLVLMIVASLTALAGISNLHFSLALILSGLAWNFMYVGGSTLLASIDDEENRPLIQGVNETFTFAVTAVCTFASGAIYAQLGWNILNIVTVVTCLALLGAFAAMHLRAPLTQ